MCTTNDSTKKRAARACKPARNHHHTQKITTSARDVRTTGGSELQNRGISAPQETSLPAAQQERSDVFQEIDVLIPPFFNKERRRTRY